MPYLLVEKARLFVEHKKKIHLGSLLPGHSDTALPPNIQISRSSKLTASFGFNSPALLMIFSKIDRDLGPAPDGGTAAWLQVVAGMLTNALTWGYSASFGVYQLYYTTDRSFSPSQVSWIGSMQVFLTFFIGVLSGRAADAGYAQETLLLGIFLGVFGTFMTSLAKEYWHIFLAQGICTGFGMGLMYMPAVVVVSSYFQKRKRLALTTAASGGGLGSVVFPLVVQNVQTRLGFARAVRVQGFIALAFGIIILVLLRPRLAPRRSGPLFEARAFLEPCYALFTAGMFLIFWALYFALFYLNSYATSVVGLSSETGANLLVIVNAVTIPARPILGYVSDKWLEPLLTMSLASMFLACMLLVWIPVRTAGALYTWAVFYGLATGGAQGMFVGAFGSLTHDSAKMGTRFGMVCSVLAFATLAGPPTAGGIIENMDGSFLGAQIWAGVITMFGSLLIGAALWADRRSRAGGWKSKETLAASEPNGQAGNQVKEP